MSMNLVNVVKKMVEENPPIRTESFLNEMKQEIELREACGFYNERLKEEFIRFTFLSNHYDRIIIKLPDMTSTHTAFYKRLIGAYFFDYLGRNSFLKVLSYRKKSRFFGLAKQIPDQWLIEVEPSAFKAKIPLSILKDAKSFTNDGALRVLFVAKEDEIENYLIRNWNDPLLIAYPTYQYGDKKIDIRGYAVVIGMWGEDLVDLNKLF